MQLRQINSRTITGLSISTNNALEMAPETGQIPALWQEFNQNVTVNYQDGGKTYGVYFNYESDHNGQYSVLAGSEHVESKHPNLVDVDIVAGQYLVFSKQGEMPQIAIDAWAEVWHYFASPDCPHKRSFTTDFEFYPSEQEIELHIAIK